MKPDPKAEARRWLKQAEHQLEVATKLLGDAFFAESCFSAEQTGQVALKAFLYGQGERFVAIHSVKQLAEQWAGYDARFQAIIDGGRVRDHYDIPTRYPDALAFPAVPFESYSEREATEAVSVASAIVKLVRENLG